MTGGCVQSHPLPTATTGASTLGPASPERPVLWREVALGLAVFAVYSVVSSLGGQARREAALSHARDLISLERTTHLDIERPFNTWLLHHDALRVLANYEYAFTYILSAFILFGWL